MEEYVGLNEHPFKRFIVLSLLCLWTVCSHLGGVPDSLAQQDRLFPDENPGEAPSMVVPETSFDFGEVNEGSVVSHDFVVRNMGRASLQIIKVSPG